MIKNVIFDLGNVLLRFRPHTLLKETFKNEDICEALMKAVFKAPEWIELDKGTMTDAEATDAFVRHNPVYENEIREIMSKWTLALTPIEAHVRVLEDLKKDGYKLYILSNFHKTAFEEQQDLHPFFECFDGGVVSAYVHQLKPDHDIYRSLMAKYDLVPENSLFLDDMLENIEAAKELGIHGIQVTENIDLPIELKAYTGGNKCKF